MSPLSKEMSKALVFRKPIKKNIYCQNYGYNKLDSFIPL